MLKNKTTFFYIRMFIAVSGISAVEKTLHGLTPGSKMIVVNIERRCMPGFKYITSGTKE